MASDWLCSSRSDCFLPRLARSSTYTRCPLFFPVRWLLSWPWGCPILSVPAHLQSGGAPADQVGRLQCDCSSSGRNWTFLVHPLPVVQPAGYTLRRAQFHTLKLHPSPRSTLLRDSYSAISTV